MATILKHGKYRVIKCPKCECEYSFELYELDENNTLKCPECGNENAATIQTESKSK